jgi:hypothetical protein
MSTDPVQLTSPPPETLQQVSGIAQFVFGAYMVVLNILTITGFFGKIRFDMSLEVRFLVIAVLGGALGSYVHAATSFVDYLGNRKFVKSWTWWYLLRPFIGVALALLIYFAVRGGLISASTGAGGLSPYGVAAIAGMAGLFSKQATDKLREVFEVLFKTDHPPARSDKLTG